MARSRYKIFENEHPYFATGTIIDCLPLFFKPGLVQILLDALTFLRKMDRMILYAYVVMENHIHLIASAGNLSKELGDFKSFTARKIIDYLREQRIDGILKKLAEEKQPFELTPTNEVKRFLYIKDWQTRGLRFGTGDS